MKQLESALRNAGYLPSHEVRRERDRAIGALVRTRKAKRKGAKVLKAKVLALVSALRIPAPVGALVALVVVLAMPSLALAHPGHGDHGPDMNGPGAVVLVGVTLGLAAHAWATWGDRRKALAVAGDGSIAGGSDPEPTSEPTLDERHVYVPSTVAGYEGTCAECGCMHYDEEHTGELTDEQRAWARANMAPYYTVMVPYVAPKRATEWHPTEPTGPFSVLSRGAYPSVSAARSWADSHLGGAPYYVVLVVWDYANEVNHHTTVFTTEGN